LGQLRRAVDVKVVVWLLCVTRSHSEVRITNDVVLSSGHLHLDVARRQLELVDWRARFKDGLQVRSQALLLQCQGF